MIKITDALKARIRDHEGCVDTVYFDTLGKATVGIGHLVQPHETKRFYEGVKISHSDIEELFELDLNRAAAGAEELIEKRCPDKKLPVRIQEVLLEMCFQLGKTGVSKFNKMFICLNNGQWRAASIEMKDSLWYKQTPHRCEALAKIVAGETEDL